MTLRNVSILFLAGLLAGLLGGALPAPGARALVPPEPGAQAGAPVESWLVSLQGPSVYRRLMADAEGAALVAAQVPADIAPLARRLEAEVLDGQRDSIRAAEGLGIRVISRYSASGNGLLVHATSAQAAALLGQPGVIRVEPALMVRPQLTMSRPHIGATRLASELGYDGSGSYVAVIDTGVDYTHAHLGGPGDPAVWTAATAAGATEVITDTYLGERIFPNDKVVAGWDFVGRRYNPPHICSDADMAAGTCTNIPEPDPDPIDGGNHGTHVSGIVAGEAIDGIGDGIAPGAKIVGLKLYGRGGADEAIDLLADAIDYCTRVNLGIEDRGVTPPRVDAINTSLGEVWAQGSRLFDEIVEAAVGSGIAIASSAGNSGDVPFVQNAPPASPKMMSIASSVPPSESKVLEVVARWEDQEARYDGIDSSLVSFADKGAVEGDLAWYGQACNDGDGNPTPPVQEQSEKVSLIARGTCTFSEKLLNAQAAGAIAVVMYTDNRAKNAMGGGADGIDIPSLMIDNADGRALQTLLEAGTAVSVSIDPAKIRTVLLPGDAVSGFSSRGPSKNGALKPDITAPGSEIVSALAGSGTGGAAFSGTSMASPMVAGAAAVIQQRNRDEGLGLDGLGISQLLMNYARPVIYAGSPDNRMPVVRQGAGLVDLWGAGTGRLRVAAGDIASINLGMVSLTEAWSTTRSMTIYNLDDQEARVTVSAGFRAADDVDKGLSLTLPDGPLTVPAGGSLEVPVDFAFAPEVLREWTQWPELAGQDPGQMDALELDGWILVTPADEAGQPQADAPVVSVPYYALPRRASAIAAEPLAEALEAPDAPLRLTNASDYPGRVELFALPQPAIRADGPGGEPDFEGGLDPDEPEVLEELDIRAVGVRVEPATAAMTRTLLSFAIARHARAAIPRVTRYDVWVDADSDGTIDHRIWETVIGGRVMTHYGAWDAEAGAMVEGTESDEAAGHTTDLHSYVSTLSVPIEALGTETPKPFLFYVTNFGTNEDWLFMPGTRYERVPDQDVAPDGAMAADGPRYFFDADMLARLPEAWSLELAGGESLEVPLSRGPGETDASWLLIYAGNAHDGADRQAQVLVPGVQLEPPTPDGLFLPLLLRAFDLAGEGLIGLRKGDPVGQAPAASETHRGAPDATCHGPVRRGLAGSDARGRRSRAGLVALLVATGLAAGPGSTAGPPGGLRRAQAQPQPTEADAAAIHLPAVLAAAGASDLATPRAPGPGATPSARSSEPATPTLTTTPGARASATADPTAASSPTGAPTPHIVVEGQEVRSAHYALHVEVLDGREIGQLLEALHPQLTAHFGGAPAEILRGGIYADRPSYVAALAADGIQDPGGGGYYAPQTRKFYLFVQPSDHYSRQLTIHEATHQFHYLAGTENRGASGGWYVEGLAEYFGMHAWDGERLETGVVPWVTLEDYPAQALARFDARGQDLAALIADRGDWPRPPGWALVHFLMHTRPDEAKALFERLDRREDPTEAWEAVFGPVDGAWADAYRAWLVGHQQPWQEVWRAFQQWGATLEGKSNVNAIALLKQTPQRLAVEIEPVSGSLRAGLVFGYRSSGDFHLFQVLADGRVWVLRFADGQWTFLHQGQAAEPGPDGRHRLAIEQGDAELRLLANGVEVTRLAAEGRLGLNVDGCRVRFHLR